MIGRLRRSRRTPPAVVRPVHAAWRNEGRQGGAREADLLAALEEIATPALTAPAGTTLTKASVALRPDLSYGVNFVLTGWGPAFHLETFDCRFTLARSLERLRALLAGHSTDEAEELVRHHHPRGPDQSDPAIPFDVTQAVHALVGACGHLIDRQRLVAAAAARHGLTAPIVYEPTCRGGMDGDAIDFARVLAPSALVDVLLQWCGHPRHLAAWLDITSYAAHPNVVRHYDHDDPASMPQINGATSEMDFGALRIRTAPNGDPLLAWPHDRTRTMIGGFTIGGEGPCFDGHVLKTPCPTLPESVVAAMVGRRVGDVVHLPLDGVADCVIASADYQEPRLVMDVTSPLIRLGDHPLLGRHIKPIPSLWTRFVNSIGMRKTS